MDLRGCRWMLTLSLLALAIPLAIGMSVSAETGKAPLASADFEAMPPSQTKPVARMLVFYSESCPHCQVIVNEFLPDLKKKYGAQLDYTLIEISNPTRLQTLVALERAYGIPAERATIPEIFLGYDVFLGEAAIKKDLEATIIRYLASGGVDLTSPMKQALVAAQQKAPTVVQAVLFHMPTCAHCEEVIRQVLPILQQRYADQLQIKLIDVSSDEAYEKFSRYMQAQLGSEELVGVPTMVISSTAMLGAADIAKRAEPTILEYLSKKGTRYPNLPEGLGGPEYQLPTVATPATTPAVRVSPTSVAMPGGTEEKRAIHLAYFYQPGCQECDRVQLALNYLQSRYPQVAVTSFDVKEYAALNEWLGKRAGVPETRRMTAPSIFVGQDALVGEGIYLDSLEALLAKYQATGAPKVWEEFKGEQAEESIIYRFLSLSKLTVVGAGLLDGLNPCAFATLVFFISYLTFSGRKGREVLFVGLVFTLGVFLTYLTVGLGLWKALGALSFLTAVGRWIYILTAALCLVLAILSLLDFFKARRGQAEEMRLSLPRALRRWINAIIRGGQNVRTYAPVAFVTGAAVSLVELACTGQVYLPTIIFVLSVPELRVRAFLYLLLYNLFFIAPLIVVFLFAYYGTTAAQFGKLLRTHAATIKLGTAILFLALAGWLIYSLI